jgi:signal transduction histidine kinase
MHLGLDATIERIRLAGGEIDIDSTPGEGTRISFELPGAEVEAEQPDVVAVGA